MDMKWISGPFQCCQVSPWSQQGNVKHSSAASAALADVGCLSRLCWLCHRSWGLTQSHSGCQGADPDLCHQAMPTAVWAAVNSRDPLSHKTQLPTTLLGLSCLLLTEEHDFVQLWNTPEQVKCVKLVRARSSLLQAFALRSAQLCTSLSELILIQVEENHKVKLYNITCKTSRQLQIFSAFGSCLLSGCCIGPLIPTWRMWDPSIITGLRSPSSLLSTSSSLLSSWWTSSLVSSSSHFRNKENKSTRTASWTKTR